MAWDLAVGSVKAKVVWCDLGINWQNKQTANGDLEVQRQGNMKLEGQFEATPQIWSWDETLLTRASTKI